MGQTGEFSEADFSINKSWKIAVIKARFNSDIVEKLEGSFVKTALELGLDKGQLEFIEVPGALEIPLATSWALNSVGCVGAVTLGSVIRGETTHYEYVCNGVERGLTQLQLSTGKPIAQVVLTTENHQQALDRCGGSAGDKGEEGAKVLIQMLSLKHRLLTEK